MTPSDIVADGIKRLVLAAEYKKELGKKSNAELADLLIDRVWSRLEACGRAAVIVEEAVDRLKGGRE